MASPHPTQPPPQPRPTIAIAGATGNLGSHLTRTFLTAPDLAGSYARLVLFTRRDNAITRRWKEIDGVRVVNWAECSVTEARKEWDRGEGGEEGMLGDEEEDGRGKGGWWGDEKEKVKDKGDATARGIARVLELEGVTVLVNA
jgi:hypothetical protein